jgi:hypothetical protein
MSRSKLFLALTIPVFILLISLALTPVQAAGQYLPNEVVVKLHQASDLASVASDYALDPTPLDQFGTRAIYRMRILGGAILTGPRHCLQISVSLLPNRISLGMRRKGNSKFPGPKETKTKRMRPNGLSLSFVCPRHILSRVGQE